MAVVFKPCQSGEADHQLVAVAKQPGELPGPDRYRCTSCDAVFQDVFKGVDAGMAKPRELYGRLDWAKRGEK